MFYYYLIRGNFRGIESCMQEERKEKQQTRDALARKRAERNGSCPSGTQVLRQSMLLHTHTT